MTDSPIERELLAALLEYVDPTPLTIGEYTLFTQYEVEGVGRLDFALIGPRRIAVEADGHPWHERTPEQATRDRARDRALTLAGWVVLRFTGQEIHRRPEECAAEVMQALNLSGGAARQDPALASMEPLPCPEKDGANSDTLDAPCSSEEAERRIAWAEAEERKLLPTFWPTAVERLTAALEKAREEEVVDLKSEE